MHTHYIDPVQIFDNTVYASDKFNGQQQKFRGTTGPFDLLKTKSFVDTSQTSLEIFLFTFSPFLAPRSHTLSLSFVISFLCRPFVLLLV